MKDPFCPGATVEINVSSSSQRVALGIAAGGQNLRLFNGGTAKVWLAFGGSDVVATTSGMPVGGNDFCEVITVPRNATHVAAIAAGSTGIISFTVGVGI